MYMYLHMHMHMHMHSIYIYICMCTVYSLCMSFRFGSDARVRACQASKDIGWKGQLLQLLNSIIMFTTS